MNGSSELELAVIPCSLRAASANRGLARAAVELAPADARLLLIDGLPLFSQDHEVDGDEPALEAGRSFREAIRSVDAVLICTPEYDGYPPAMTLNALNWLSREPDPPLSGKPVAVAGAAGGFRGSRRSQAHVRQVLETMGARTIEQHFYVQIGERFDQAGELVDRSTVERFREFLKAVVDDASAALTA